MIDQLPEGTATFLKAEAALEKGDLQGGQRHLRNAMGENLRSDQVRDSETRGMVSEIQERLAEIRMGLAAQAEDEGDLEAAAHHWERAEYYLRPIGVGDIPEEELQSFDPEEPGDGNLFPDIPDFDYKDPKTGNATY